MSTKKKPAQNNHFQLGSSVLVVGSDQPTREKKAEELSGVSLSSLANNPDGYLLKAEKSIGIEEIRNLQKNLSLKPFAQEKKVAFIFEAQNLTPEAQNALLKTLEEPSSHSLIILSSPDPSWLLPTVVSRCQIVFLPGKTIQFDEDEKKHCQAFLDKILLSNASQRFLLLEKEEVGKDRVSAENWLEKNIIILRELLLILATKQPLVSKDKKKVSQYNRLLSSLLRLRKYLNANCNVRLSLEVFLLDLSFD